MYVVQVPSIKLTSISSITTVTMGHVSSRSFAKALVKKILKSSWVVVILYSFLIPNHIICTAVYLITYGHV